MTAPGGEDLGWKWLAALYSPKEQRLTAMASIVSVSDECPFDTPATLAATAVITTIHQYRCHHHHH